jgi:hypothetical protein
MDILYEFHFSSFIINVVFGLVAVQDGCKRLVNQQHISDYSVDNKQPRALVRHLLNEPSFIRCLSTDIECLCI